jgi:hypothetical protein
MKDDFLPHQNGEIVRISDDIDDSMDFLSVSVSNVRDVLKKEIVRIAEMYPAKFEKIIVTDFHHELESVFLKKAVLVIVMKIKSPEKEEKECRSTFPFEFGMMDNQKTDQDLLVKGIETIVRDAMAQASGEKITAEPARILFEPLPDILTGHHFGLQLGGSAIATVNYRYNISENLLLDAGIFPASDFGIFTGGIILTTGMENWGIYLGLGMTLQSGFNPAVNRNDIYYDTIMGKDIFGYIRAGIHIPLHGIHHHLLIDASFWSGKTSEQIEAPAGTKWKTHAFSRIVPGISYNYAF